MWEIWANQLLPKTLKSCPKSNKSPNLVTLHTSEKRAAKNVSLKCIGTADNVINAISTKLFSRSSEHRLISPNCKLLWNVAKQVLHNFWWFVISAIAYQQAPCTCSLVSVQQEQVRAFCCCRKRLTRFQQSNFPIIGQHQWPIL